MKTKKTESLAAPIPVHAAPESVHPNRVDFAYLVGDCVAVSGWILGFADPDLAASIEVKDQVFDLKARATRVRRPDVTHHLSLPSNDDEHGFYVLLDLADLPAPLDQLRLIVTPPAGDTADGYWTIEGPEAASALFVEPALSSIQTLLRQLSSPEARRLSEFMVKAMGSSSDAESALRLEIDSPALAQGAAVSPIRGSLRVEGWAVARVGVASVSAFVDGVESAEAYYGVRREDVALVHPDWDGAANSGFGLSIPAKLLTVGEHKVRIAVRDLLGREISRTFSVIVELTADISWPDALRMRIPVAELHLDKLVLSSLRHEPSIELFMPVRNSNLESARTTLATLCNQALDAWTLTVSIEERGKSLRDTQLRLLDGFSLLPGKVLFREPGKRLKHLPNSQPHSNDAEMLRAILKPGDRLGQDALLELALASAQNSDADFVYSDERRIDPVSGKMAAYFKPDWSPELLLSSNYIGRLWVATPQLLRRAGITLGEDSLSEYEMVLRLTRAAHKIVHVPKILCERGNAQLDQPDTERNSLLQAAEAMGIRAEIQPGCTAGVYRFKRAVKKRGLVSIVIPTCGSKELIRTCISSLRRVTTNNKFEIICVENTPPGKFATRRWIKNHADQTIRTREPFNWSRFNNLGVRAASPNSEYLLFLNDDIEAFEPDWLDALLEHGQRNEIGVTGALLLYPDRSIQHAGLFTVGLGLGRHAHRFAPQGDPGSFGRALTQRNVLAVTGACMLFKHSFFQSLGGFDEAHSIINNDLDICLRSLDRGKQVVFTPYARLIHHEMSSRSSMADIYEVKTFEKTWQQKCAEGDPFYNPCLSRAETNLSTDLEPVQVVYGGHPITQKYQVRSILAIKLDHLGDFITAFPAFRRIKQRFPHAKLFVLASSGTTKLAMLEASIDEVIEFNFFQEESGRGQIEISAGVLAELRERLNKQRFDLAIDLRKHPETRELLRLSGARLTAGFDSESRFPWLDIALEWDNDRPLVVKRQHISDDLLRLVETVAIACEDDRRTICDTATKNWQVEDLADFVDIRLFDKPVVCIHPAAGNLLRVWPAKYFAQLLELIHAEYDVNLVMIGGQNDRKIIDAISAAIHPPTSVLSLAGQIPLQRLPQFLSRCALMVGNNSGPQHLAAGLGVPTVGIYSGVVDAREWAPLGPAAVAVRRDMTCSPCYLAHPQQCYRGIACLNELKPGDVLATCRKLLAIRGANAHSGRPGAHASVQASGVNKVEPNGTPNC